MSGERKAISTESLGLRHRDLEIGEFKSLTCVRYYFANFGH